MILGREDGEGVLCVAVRAGHLHLALVRVVVARGAILRQPQVAVLALGEESLVRIRVALGARELEVLAIHWEPDARVLEIIAPLESGVAEALDVDDREPFAVVVAVADRAVAGELRVEDSVQPCTRLDVLCNRLVAFEARVRHRLEPTAVALRTTVRVGELGDALVHVRQGSGRGSIEIVQDQHQDGRSAERPQKKCRRGEVHALTPSKKRAP